MDKTEFQVVIKDAMSGVVDEIKKETEELIKSVKEETAKELDALKSNVKEKAIHDDKAHSGIDVKEKEPEFITNTGKFFQCVAKASSDVGMKVKLAEALEGYWKEKAPSGLNTIVSSEGGFLPTAEIAKEIKGVTYETGQLLKEVDIMPLGDTSDRYVWREAVNEDRSTANSYNGIVTYWVNEGVAATTSNPTFREREIAVKDLMARIPVTRQLLADSTALGAMIMKDTPKSINKTLDRAIFRGTGAGQPLGVINAASTITVAAEGSQGTDTIIKENIEKMYDNLDPDMLSGSKWYVNPHARKELRNLVMAVGTGGAPVYLPEGSMSGSPYGTLLGLPVVPTNACSKLGDLGDIVLGNMSDYLIVEKGGIEAAESMHVLFNTNELLFRFTWRINGMPKLAAQITPENANAADRLSSFVTLAAR